MKLQLLATILAMALASAVASAQSKLFKECEKIPDVTTVYISKLMISNFGNSNIRAGGLDVGLLVSKLDGVEVINTESSKSAARIKKLMDDLSAYEVLISVREEDSKVDILYKTFPDKRNEFIIIAEEDDELSVITLTGTLSLEDVTAAARL